MAEVEHETLDIPSEGLTIRKALSMDIGGSLTKIVYTSDEGDKIKLHFMSYPRPQTKDAIRQLRDKIDVRQEDGVVINTCGVGFQEYGDYLRQELNVTVKVNEELNCFIEGFHYMMNHVPLEDLLYQDAEGFNLVIHQVATLIAGGVNSLSGRGKHWEVAKDEQVGDQKVQYPILLCMLGSGGCSMKMEADGSFKVCQQYTRCGRTILGLANLLVGTKTFPELIDLATKGDGSQLHIQAKHLLSGAGDVYDKIPGDFMVYSFGQAAKNFSKEDIAAALVGMLAEDMAQTCHLTAASHNISHIFLCGSVVGASPYIRQHMKMVLSVKDILNSLSKRYHSYFLKFGGYYGAIGALLKTLKPNGDYK